MTTQAINISGIQAAPSAPRQNLEIENHGGSVTAISGIMYISEFPLYICMLRLVLLHCDLVAPM